MASVNPEFDTTLSLIAIKRGTAEGRRLNCALFKYRPKHLYNLVPRVSLLSLPRSDPGYEVGMFSNSSLPLVALLWFLGFCISRHFLQCQSSRFL